jgi:hypothetical protein
MAKIYGNRWLVKKSLNEGGQSVVFIVEDRTGKLPGSSLFCSQWPMQTVIVSAACAP